MPRLESDNPNDVTVYLVEEDFGKRPGLPRDARRRGGPRDDHPELHLRAVAAFSTAEGWSRYGSEDIAFEVLDQAYDADECKERDQLGLRRACESSVKRQPLAVRSKTQIRS
jgi:hypothetical protein